MNMGLRNMIMRTWNVNRGPLYVIMGRWNVNSGPWILNKEPGMSLWDLEFE